jgi:hypothetical protein
MRGPLSRLPVALKAEAKPSQQPADQFLAGGETALSKRADEAALAPADPPQRCLRIATDRRLDQFLQCVQQSGLSPGLRLAAAARPANTARQLGIVAPQLHKTTPDRAARNPRRLRHRRDAAPACRERFIRCEQPPRALVKIGRQPRKARLDRIRVDHPDWPEIIRPPNQIIANASRPFREHPR